MAMRKRKRTCYIEHACFPDETPREEEKKNSHAPVAAASISDAWHHCGDGFQISSSLEAKESLRKPVSAKKSFASLLSSSEEISKTENLCEFTDIIWSSSGSDFSDEENDIAASDFLYMKMKKYRKYALISKEVCNKEPEFIEWKNDSDYEHDEQCSESEGNEAPLDILDTDSCPNSTFKADGEKEDEPSKISEYPSDDDNFEGSNVETEATNSEFPKKFQFCFGVGFETDTGRSATDWLKSVQTLLQTPKKKIEKSLKTPEDSAKKRKLLRGGLAERLNTLQNRKRSAVNFWRHQCTSHHETPSGGKPGVLIVKILEMHEECTLCIAICHQLGQICADGSIIKEIVEIQPRLKVLFAKETTAHLKAVPQDVIYIHPPWQKLFLRNENIPVILNTYFSQKITLKESTDISTDMDKPLLHEPMLAKRNVSLAWVFNLSDIKDNCSLTHANQVSVISLNDSLLDVVEMQGTTESTAIQVQVVIQRVYYLVIEDGFRCHRQGSNPPQNMAPFLKSDLQNLRLCLLVQDTYGIFSEIQLPVLCSSSQLIEQYRKKWEGKCCLVSRLKILRRVTRGRTLGLFSLIDSLWPPLLPLQVPDKRQGNKAHLTANQIPPSFCYILAASADYIDADEREQLSNLYFPPAVHSLEEIYQEMASTSPDQRQFWLFVTDFSLQRESENNSGTPKTLPVSVSSSCVIDVEVMEAFKSSSPCIVFFKDAMCRNGKIICIERTVLLLQKPLLCRTAGADITELTGPVKLDYLDSTTQINSICTVRGTVVGINERTAFSWPICNRCGNEKIDQDPQNKGLLYCSHCCEVVTSPVIKMHLEVFLNCQSQSNSTIKIKLLQKSISSLLESATMDDGSYEVTSVLRKEVGFLNCYVQSITSHPSSCIGLEEIVLSEA
ncbi:DNA repair-scaffolding protein isoform X2 [Ahaetulla prasina]|uniref:DNA repair-scaffolding protein isoform X2 n=1 Tax=Ahaetulla prasina TaxID=499056 RepID=UPI002648EADF|nr:DNA repair-scaffolding protein isoform X2 [Ahaetulla prasina]